MAVVAVVSAVADAPAWDISNNGTWTQGSVSNNGGY
jgi:hypothetical protein